MSESRARGAIVSLDWRASIVVVLSTVAAQATILHLMGRVAICSCGTIDLWYGDVNGPGNSQHLTDWYTPSHLIHGFLFYLGARLILPRAPIAVRLALALGVEVAWEIVENSDFIINRYREETAAIGYTGDSIINSIADTLAALAGFVMAARLPIWIVAALALAMELLAGVVIRDNLTLNVIMLLHPFDAIKEWQSGL